jgi:uncharacterized membrane protein
MAELTFVRIVKRNKGLYVALAGLLIAAIVINFATGVNFFKLNWPLFRPAATLNA